MTERHRGRLRSAAVWSYAENLGKLFITTGVTLVLAAMLGPRAYGIIAMALAFTNFIEMIQQQGMMPAIISQEKFRDRHADTAFWIVLVISFLCTGVGVAIAPWWADLNRTPELVLVIWALAVTIPLTSSAVVHEAILRRELRFRAVALRSWVSGILSGIAGIAAALAHWGVWALVAQQVVSSVTSVIVLWSASHWRPRLHFSRDAATELWRYSLRATGSSLGLFIANRVDVILAGAFFGPSVVGLYRMGQRLTSMVVTVAGRAMHSVSLPGLSRLQHDKDAFRHSLARMQRTTSSLALPALAIVAGVAPDIEGVLGPEWRGTAPVIRVLAIAQMVSSLSLLLGPALQASRRPGLLAIIMWVWSGAMIIAVVAAAQVSTDSDIMALCVAVCGGYLVGTALHVGAVSCVLHVPLGHMARAWAPGVVGAAAGGLTATYLTAVLEIEYPLLEVCITGGTGVLVSAVVVLGPRRLSTLGRRVGRMGSSASVSSDTRKGDPPTAD